MTAAILFVPVLVGLFVANAPLGQRAGERAAVEAVPPTPDAVVQPPAVPVAASSSAVAAALHAGSAPSEGGPHREVCGAGQMKLEPGDADKARERLMAQLRERTRQGRAEWLAAARAHLDEQVRAAGLLVEAASEGARSSAYFERALACKDVRSCEERVQEEAVAVLEPLRAPARNRLARMAADSNDPVVYALAMNACEARQWNAPPGACQLLSVEQWARLDPGNAAVWLAVAAQAGSGTPAQAEALRRAGRADEIKLRFLALLPLLQRAEPAGTAELARSMMVSEVVDLLTASPLYAVDVGNVCTRPQLNDANRREDCAALANTLAQRGELVIHRMAGRTLGERLGWPADTLAAMRREVEAIVELRQGVHNPRADDALGCAAIERQARVWTDTARSGELAAWREEIARSGRSVQELSDALRARQRAWEARRASAASTPRP